MEFSRGWGTLDTSIYEPQSRTMMLRWPDLSRSQSIDDFRETSVALTFSGQPASEHEDS